MPSKLTKFAPIAAVAGTLGYLCWPYFDDPTAAKAKPAAKSAEPLASLLAVKAPGEVRADLFEVPVVEIRKAAKGTGSTGGKPGSGKQSTSPRDAKASLVLSGTYVAGDSRYAIINGSLYSEGDQIASAKSGRSSGKAAAEGPETCTLKHVDLDKVVLDFQGQTRELRYSDSVLPSAGGSPAAGAGSGHAAGDSSRYPSLAR
jgi:hypothetical protein